MKPPPIFPLAGLMAAGLSQRRPAQHVFDAALTRDASAGRKPATSIPLDQIGAVYPVRIDPSFSDANWINIGGIPGADGRGYATAMDGAGKLYIGGRFTKPGGGRVNNIA